MNTLEAFHARYQRQILCMLVGSCLQCRGASAISFVNHWWHFTLTRISVWPCCTPGPSSTSTWCSASDGGYLRRQKGLLEKTARSPAQRLAQQDARWCQCSNAIYVVEIWDRHGSRSGAKVTRTMMEMMITCQKWRVKLIFQGSYRLSRTGIVECLNWKALA